MSKRLWVFHVLVFSLFFWIGGAAIAASACGPEGAIPSEGFVWPAGGSISQAWTLDCATDRGHRGIDIDLDAGVPVVAAASGKVAFVGFTPAEGGGTTLTIDHEGGLRTTYLHLSSVSVHQGQTVGQGEQLALSDGRDLHFGIKRPAGSSDLYYDPVALLPAFVQPAPDQAEGDGVPIPQPEPENDPVPSAPPSEAELEPLPAQPAAPHGEVEVPATAPVEAVPAKPGAGADVSPAGPEPAEAPFAISESPTAVMSTIPEAPAVVLPEIGQAAPVQPSIAGDSASASSPFSAASVGVEASGTQQPSHSDDAADTNAGGSASSAPAPLPSATLGDDADYQQEPDETFFNGSPFGDRWPLSRPAGSRLAMGREPAPLPDFSWMTMAGRKKPGSPLAGAALLLCATVAMTGTATWMNRGHSRRAQVDRFCARQLLFLKR